MNLPKYTGPRFKLELGKYHVLRVIDRGFGVKEFSLRIDNTTLVITSPRDADIREGDLLSLYTEVAINVQRSS